MPIATVSRPMITLIADGSYHPDKGEAAWAGRVIFEQQRKTYTGAYLLPQGSSNDVEIEALCQTFLAAQREQVFGKGAGVLLQSDNMHAVKTLNHHFGNRALRSWPAHCPRLTPRQEASLAAFRAALSQHEPDWVFAKHVKGHMAYGQRAARHHVQEAMDHAASEARRKLRMG